MNLRDYIGEIGIDRFARMHGISYKTAESYRQNRRRPRVELATAIIAKSHGRVTWEGIYRPGGERRSRRSPAPARV